MHFGSTLKLLRVDAGLSLRALASRIGVSSAYLSRVENGHDPAPTPDRLSAIAHALQLPVDTLVELAHQTGPALADYIRRVPAASAFFLEVARRDLGPEELARLRRVMDEELTTPPLPEQPEPPLLSTLIGPRVVLDLPCSNFGEVIVAGVGCCVPGPAAEDIIGCVEERERTSPTALGNRVAVPHAIVPSATTRAALVTLASPLGYASPDGQPVEVAIVLVSSSGGRQHLELLAQIARLARHGAADALRSARTPRQALAVIERFEAV